MSLSASQRAFLMSKPCKAYRNGGLWWQACQMQGWNFDDRELRLQVISDAAGQSVESASDLDNKGFDRVKARLLTLAEKLRGATEEISYEQGSDPGEARRVMHHVRELLLELEDLHPEPGQYVATLLAGVTRGRYGVRGVEDLGTEPRFDADAREKISELEQFRRTLNARIHGKNGLAKQNLMARAVEQAHAGEAAANAVPDPEPAPEEELEGEPY